MGVRQVRSMQSKPALPQNTDSYIRDLQRGEADIQDSDRRLRTPNRRVSIAY